MKFTDIIMKEIAKSIGWVIGHYIENTAPKIINDGIEKLCINKKKGDDVQKIGFVKED